MHLNDLCLYFKQRKTYLNVKIILCAKHKNHVILMSSLKCFFIVYCYNSLTTDTVLV